MNIHSVWQFQCRSQVGSVLAPPRPGSPGARSASAARNATTLAVAGILFAFSTGPARAECVTIGNVTDCTGAFASPPKNASVSSLGALSQLDTTNRILNVTGLTQPIFADGFAPGVFLNAAARTGASGGNVVGDGGDGRDGYFADSVTINFDGGNYIDAFGAPGIHGISRGGNGGNGGDGTFKVLVLPTYGGDGGNARRGSNVTILVFPSGTGTGQPDIFTEGANGHGILAESLGGNGGSGGDGLGTVGTGGNGGSAAGGGVVYVDNRLNILTNGTNSHGIYALSAGGRGGAGGDGTGFVGDGGLGGRTAPGGRAIVINGGDIRVRWAESNGVRVQSIGGFGGAGGSGGGAVGYGSSGASAGDGARAELVNFGNVFTESRDSHGLVAQSIGGGGGVGGGGAGIVGLGADGTPGGSGGDVLLRNVLNLATSGGSIQTFGVRSDGIFAQSIGGGGGDGGGAIGIGSLGGKGSSASNAGYVRVENRQAITTAGDKSRAIFAQSIGGGGGDGGASAGVFTVGGRGGPGGDSSEVTVENSGNLKTAGDRSEAIFAQSIGGGGGNGGLALAGGPGFAMSIGGAGGSGGDALFAVGVNPYLTLDELQTTSNTGSISTGNAFGGGYRSHGIFAQSLGGGGGNGGFAFAGSVGESVSAAIAVGGNGGAGGDGSEVKVQQRGTINTGGDEANGIFAQSLGGGGGNGGGTVAAALSGGKSVSIAWGGKGGTGGKSSTVEVNHVGAIATRGTQANGIFAQSVGGGGGTGGFSVAAGLGEVAASFALGGDGGAGSMSDDVTVGFCPPRPLSAAKSSCRIRPSRHAGTTPTASSRRASAAAAATAASPAPYRWPPRVPARRLVCRWAAPAASAQWAATSTSVTRTTSARTARWRTGSSRRASAAAAATAASA